MKWIVYGVGGLLSLVGLAVVVLLVLGSRGSTLSATVEIAKPAATVFNWVATPQKHKSWVSWLVDVQDLTPGNTGAGAKHVYVMEDRNNNNQRMDIASEVTRYEEARRLEARLEAKEGFTGTVHYELQPIDANHTRLVYTADYTFHHWLAKLLGPVIRRSAQQKLEEDLARLKQHAEAE